jgi:hypothetical protein
MAQRPTSLALHLCYPRSRSVPPPVPPGPTFLFDAIERYYQLMLSDDPAERETFAALERWFQSRDHAGPDAFEVLCAQYRVDPDAIRGMLRRRRRSARRV